MRFGKIKKIMKDTTKLVTVAELNKLNLVKKEY